jgi:23S rRNA (cytidine1920-2'-O)/16S rRNA (cytidine1409-2'-O)-methyltransferase
MSAPSPEFVSRGGAKLAAALDAFGLSVAGWTCADLGSNVGGFVDCLLQRGAARVYAVERGFGTLHYRLRDDPRVVLLERTNALTLRLPERVRLVTIDVGWTRQRRILPAAARLLEAQGNVITLVKPHYEADPAWLERGVLPVERMAAVLEPLRNEVRALGWSLLKEIESPLPGHGGNREHLWRLARMTG